MGARGNCVTNFNGEGPKAFHWKGKCWLIADCWRNGMRVWSSDDCLNWKMQDEPLLGSHGVRGTRGPLLVRQIAGSIARRIVTDGSPGDQAVQGERMGMIRFGSRVDLFLKPGAVIKVQLGDTVHAGLTILAELPA